MDIKNKKFKVEKVVFYNSQSMWGVLGLDPIDSLGDLKTELLNVYGSISASGSFEKPYENAEVIISGDVINDPRYGKQIQIKSLEILRDIASKEGVVSYLAKSNIEGLGIELATKIYETFGEDSIEVVLNRTDELIKVNGIGKKTVDKIKDSVNFTKAHEKAVKYFTQLGISYFTISKLLEEFGDESVSLVQENPFKLLDISKELSFKQVDDIYLKTGGKPEAYLRLSTAFLYLLKQQATMEGSTGCLRGSLSRKFYSLIDVAGSEDYFAMTMDKLEQEGKIVLGGGIYVYYKEYLDIEREIAEKIKSLQKSFMPSSKIKEEIVEEEINDFPFKLNVQQVNAVRDCLNTNVAVLTGAAGVGKSSITKALYNIYRRCGFSVQLMAPTAKASLRLSECTGGEARTIHKFLGLKKEDEYVVGSSFSGNYEKDTVLIIDEASMMDIILFNKLLQGATMSTRILLIGDNNQLPSVQAGNVLGDVIDSEKVHVSLLTDIMRQKEDSNIIKFCSMINDGEIFDPCDKHDFLYEEFGTSQELKEKFLPLYKKEVKEVGLNEVQVITPYKKGELGMNNLNLLLQEEMNGKSKEVMENFRVGDKVRHIQNNYKKDVFNGETGIIVKYYPEENEIRVDYDYKYIDYGKLDINELTLSYCSTVHASQGSEYKVVFVILDDTSVNDFLHIRRLLYTAVSRGKGKVYILTKPYLVDKCISNDSYRPRITKLADFLRK